MRPLCRFIHKWEDIKKHFQETVHESTMDSSGSVVAEQLGLESTVMHISDPYKSRGIS
jgi:hypothetical protein